MTLNRPSASGSSDRCPGLRRPHLAADGAMVRLRVPGGRLSLSTLAELSTIAQTWGAPQLQLTSRGNLQLRGLPEELPVRLIEQVEATGLLPSASHERVRNILASPLAAGQEALDDLATDLDAGVLARPSLAQLSGRFLFALADSSGDVLTEPFDVAWQGLPRAEDLHAGRLLLHGPAGILARPMPRHGAVAALVSCAQDFVHLRSDESIWHPRQLPRETPLTSGFEQLPPSSSLSRPLADSPSAATPSQVSPGRHTDRSGREVLVAGAPMGWVGPDQIAALTEVLALDSSLRLTPWRSLVLPADALASVTQQRLSQAGWWLTPTHQEYSACVGEPGCAKARSGARTIDLATRAMNVHEQAGTAPARPVHVVGCERRCGAPVRPHTQVLAPASVNETLNLRAEFAPARDQS